MVKRAWRSRAHPCATLFDRLVSRDALITGPASRVTHLSLKLNDPELRATTERCKVSAMLARSRWSSSCDLISDKRHWARLVSSPPVVAAKRPGAVQDQGLNPRYCRSECPIGLRGRSVAFSPLLEMPAFLRAVKCCFCLRFSRRMVSCMKGSWPCNPALLVAGSLVQRFLAQNADSRTKAAT